MSDNKHSNQSDETFLGIVICSRNCKENQTDKQMTSKALCESHASISKLVSINQSSDYGVSVMQSKSIIPHSVDITNPNTRVFADSGMRKTKL